MVSTRIVAQPSVYRTDVVGWKWTVEVAYNVPGIGVDSEEIKEEHTVIAFTADQAHEAARFRQEFDITPDKVNDLLREREILRASLAQISYMTEAALSRERRDRMGEIARRALNETHSV